MADFFNKMNTGILNRTFLLVMKNDLQNKKGAVHPVFFYQTPIMGLCN